MVLPHFASYPRLRTELLACSAFPVGLPVDYAGHELNKIANQSHTLLATVKKNGLSGAKQIRSFIFAYFFIFRLST